jgi:hypothetical protein
MNTRIICSKMECPYLARETKKLLLEREILLNHFWAVGFSPDQDLVDRKAVVHRGNKVLDVIALDPSLLSHGLVTEVPDGHSVQRRLVRLAVHGQEVVDLLLGLELGTKSLNRDADGWSSLEAWLTGIHLDLGSGNQI